MDEIQTLEAILNQYIEINPNVWDIFKNTLYTYDGHSVPRVTHILDQCISDRALAEYANKLGWQHQSFSEALERLGMIGSKVHECINNRIMNIESQPPDIEEVRCAYLAYVRWFNDVSAKNSIKVLLNEQPISCKYFGGTVDGVYEINKKIFVVDYKTSSKIYYKQFLQLAAYSYILEQMGYTISGCIILQLSKKELTYREYMLDLAREDARWYFNECKYSFLAMVLWFYCKNILDTNYKRVLGAHRR